MAGPGRGNLRARAGTLVGRDPLLGTVTDGVRNNRVVTLTGVGGVGKTRLATEVGAALVDDFPDGVWIVELETVGDPGAVADAVAATLGIAPNADQPMIELVTTAIAGRRLLLVLDNCEHVLDATASFVTALVARGVESAVLATSRVPLGHPVEHEIPVPPLALDAGASSPAVTLFTERARQVRANFELERGSPSEQAAVEICEVLDGLPLAIELAAARMAGMGVIDVRERLDDRFRLLEGSDESPQRHRSLSDLVRWSVDLLDPSVRRVLEQASVFVGGFDLAAYVGTFAVNDEVDLLRSLDRLVNSSLVVADHSQGRVRYRLLETIRQYGLDELDASASLADARDAHARYYASAIATRWESWNGPGWRPAVDLLTSDLTNLRAAFNWSSERDLVVATDLAAHAALIGFSAHQFEPINWVERILERADTADVRRLPRLYAAAGYACFIGRAAAAVEHAEHAMTLEARPDYDPCPPGLSTFIAALANVYTGNLDRYVELTAAASELSGNSRAFAWPGYVDGLQASGRVDEALARLDDAVNAAREVENPFYVAYSLWIAGMTLANTDPQRALNAWDEGLNVVDQHGVEFFRGFLARDSARLHTEHGDTNAAMRSFVLAIDAFQRAGNIAQLVITLASVPALFERLRDHEAAATMFAAMREVPESLNHVPELAALGDLLTVELGDAAAAASMTEGRAMDLDQAATYARARIDLARREQERLGSNRQPGGLTRREVEILRLITDGITTREIAEQLFISPKTADRHIQNVYSKIGTSTRATATRWAIDNGIVNA